MRVLITCVGSGVGQSAVDSLKYDKGEYFLVGSDRSRFCYSAPDCDDFVDLPPITDPTYLDEVLRVCVDRRIDVVIPGHDQELAMFARERSRFERAGIKVIVGSERLVALLRDKLAWAREFRRRTRHVVASCSVADYRSGRHADGVELPAIAKPKGGSASAGLRIVREPDDLQGLPDDYLLQTLLVPAQGDPEGERIRAAIAGGTLMQASEISVQLLYSAQGELLAKFASRNRLKGGVPIEVQPVDLDVVWRSVDELIEILADYAPAGPVNLQGRITDDGLIFFEMNPRFTGITGNRSQFGFNEVALLVDNFARGEKRELFANLNKVGVRQVACRAWPRWRYEFAARRVATPAQAIVVLGGTSWLARHFVADRAARGDRVYVICREQSFQATSILHAALPTVRVLSDASRSVRDVLSCADTVVNFVSGRPPHGSSNIAAAHLYQMRMLELAAVCEAPRLVNISSQSVYAKVPGVPSSEHSALDVSAPYAFSKYSIEETVAAVSRRHPSVSSVSLRLGRLFGAAEGMRLDEFPSRVAASAVHDARIELTGGGDALNLLDIRDAVSAVSYVVDSHESWRGEVFNVGPGEPLSPAQYVGRADELCREAFGRPLRVERSGPAPSGWPGMSCSKLAAMGWVPTIPVEQTLHELFEYFANERKQ